MFTHGSHEDAPSVSVLPAKRSKKEKPAPVFEDHYDLADFAVGGEAWTDVRKYDIRKEIVGGGQSRGTVQWVDHLRKYGLADLNSSDGPRTLAAAVDRIFNERFLGAPVTAPVVAVQGVTFQIATPVDAAAVAEVAEATMMRANSAMRAIRRRTDLVKQYEKLGGVWRIPSDVVLPADDIQIIAEDGTKDLWKAAMMPPYSEWVNKLVSTNRAKASALALKIFKGLRQENDIHYMFPKRIEFSELLDESLSYKALDNSALGLMTKVAAKFILMSQVEVK